MVCSLRDLFASGLIEHEGRDVVIALKTRQAIQTVIAKSLKHLAFLCSRGIIDKHEGIEMNKVTKSFLCCLIPLAWHPNLYCDFIYLFVHLFLILTRGCAYWFQRKRWREKHLVWAPTVDQTRNLGMCPDGKWCEDDAPTNQASLARAGTCILNKHPHGSLASDVKVSEQKTIPRGSCQPGGQEQTEAEEDK